MSMISCHRKTLYEINSKVSDYKKKPLNFQAQIMKKVNKGQHKQPLTRRRFLSTTVQVSQKQNSRTNHPLLKFLNNHQSISDQQLRKFSSFLYKGVKYSVSLKEPSAAYIQKRKLSILDVSFGGQEFNIEKKLLVLDLDETLIHSVGSGDDCDVTLMVGKNRLKFNIRPYCYRFLQQMSKHYNIVVYTASTQSYALPIVQYLNKSLVTIKAVLSRNHCLQTHNGFHIKDLRMIRQFGLESTIIIDNLVHSFAFQLNNGIPILQFINNKNDRELYYLCDRLIALAKNKDVRTEISRIYGLTKVLQHPEHHFVWKFQSIYN